MSKSFHPNIRALLKKYDDGLTIKEIANHLGKTDVVIMRSLESMPDVYLDRYLDPVRGQYPAVWCVAHIPENCPHPKANQG